MRDLRLDLGQAFQGVLLGLAGEHPLGQLELEEPSLEDVDLGRDRLELHRQPAARLVDQVDRLVGEEPVGDVPRRELGGGHQGRVPDLDLVVDLVTLLQAPQDGDRVLDRRLADEDRLESSFQRGVLLDFLSILVERRGADAPQLAPGQRRLEQVGGVHRPIGLARADDQVQLVDEQDDPPLRLGDVLEYRLETLLELAAELGTGDQRPDVEGDDLAFLEALGDVAGDDPLGQALDDRRLADARLADQDRVVLGPSREDLDDPADLRVAAYDRVHLAVAGHLHEVPAVTLQRLVLVLRVLVRDPLRRRAPSAWIGGHPSR